MRSFATGRIQPKVLFTKEWTQPHMQQSSFQAEVYTYALSNCESLTFKKRIYKAKLGGPKGWAKVEVVRYYCDTLFSTSIYRHIQERKVLELSLG